LKKSLPGKAEDSPAVVDSEKQPDSNRMTGHRRSQRVRFEMPVKIYASRQDAEPTFESGKTLTVSAHGALLALSTPVALGDKLRLINPRTDAEIDCYVRRLAMRSPTGVNQVGVEFPAVSPTFWDVELPPPDWDPAWVPPPERKRSRLPPWSTPRSAISIPEPPEDTVDKRSRTFVLQILKRWRSLSIPGFALAGLLTLGLLSMGLLSIAISRRRQAPAVHWIPAAQKVAPEDASVIPDSDSYRLATAEDFAPESSSWLAAGQQAGGDIPGSYSATGWSHAYVLIGKDAVWRVLIVANGQLLCDAQYRNLAIVARVPRNLIAGIDWSNPPPAESEGDGLLIVRNANDPASSVVLFLRGDQVVTGAPFNYYQVLKGRTP
jgi:PilZ domain-containing protein